MYRIRRINSKKILFKIIYKYIKVTKWPVVTIGIFIEAPTPFLREFLEKISKLDYPKSKIDVLIHNNVN